MRAFLARRLFFDTGTDWGWGYRPDVDYAAYGNPSTRNWDIQHPDTGDVIGFVVIWTPDFAPTEAVADLGDPTDKVSMRSVTLGQTAAAEILDVVYGPGNWNNGQRNSLANRTGVQTIRYLNNKDPVMAATMDGTLVELVDATD